MKIKKLCIDYIPMLLAAILIVAFSVMKEQSFLKTLPTLITLVVQILLSRANRFGFLLGGINSLLYGLAYFDEGLYFSVISAVAISAPIQLYSFFHWSRKQISSNRTELKLLSIKMRVLIVSMTLATWLVVYFGFAGLFAHARLPMFDSFHFVMGVVVSLLAAFRYVESQYLSSVSCMTNIAMWIIICSTTPGNSNYLVISFYNLYMVAKAAIRWTRQYVEDQNAQQSLPVQ